MGTSRPRYHWAVAVYDRVYRFWHGLDRPCSEVPPLLRVEVRRNPRSLRLGDGTLIRRGDRIGVLHLDNEHIGALHINGPTPWAVGLEFKRLMLDSLGTLAALTEDGGRLHGVRAFVATTIFHHALRRFGVEVEPDALTWPGLTAAYQRRLLASLHPDGGFRLEGLAALRAERLWISTARLVALHGAGTRRAGLGSP